VSDIQPQSAKPGDRVPDLVFGPINRTILALYAGASRDHNPIHIDTDFARKAGMADVFVHGSLAMAQLGRAVSDWAGQDRIRELATRFTAITPVGATMTCTGEVVERFEQDGETRLKLKLAACIDDGTETLQGEAVVAV
jgi:acyl dehydratase